MGPVHTTLLQALINTLLTDALLPLLNAVLGPGLPLPPLDGLALDNTTVAFGSGYVLLATDIGRAAGGL